MVSSVSYNILLDSETQPKAAALPRWLCSGQRLRYISRGK